jgi:hypothetical protein
MRFCAGDSCGAVWNTRRSVLGVNDLGTETTGLAVDSLAVRDRKRLFSGDQAWRQPHRTRRKLWLPWTGRHPRDQRVGYGRQRQRRHQAGHRHLPGRGSGMGNEKWVETKPRQHLAREACCNTGYGRATRASAAQAKESRRRTLLSHQVPRGANVGWPRSQMVDGKFLKPGVSGFKNHFLS